MEIVLVCLGHLPRRIAHLAVHFRCGLLFQPATLFWCFLTFRRALLHFSSAFFGRSPPDKCSFVLNQPPSCFPRVLSPHRRAGTTSATSVALCGSPSDFAFPLSAPATRTFALTRSRAGPATGAHVVVCLEGGVVVLRSRLTAPATPFLFGFGCCLGHSIGRPSFGFSLPTGVALSVAVREHGFALGPG